MFLSTTGISWVLLNLISLLIIIILIWVFFWLIWIVFKFIFTKWEEKNINLVYTQIKQLIIWIVFISFFFIAFFSFNKTVKPIWYKLFTSDHVYDNTIRIISILSDENNYNKWNTLFKKKYIYNYNSQNFSL
jgi:heme/copper-type cytochrome/quinol oxidase subunit 2